MALGHNQWRHWRAVTDLDSGGADVEHADGASDEVADGFEVNASDAPGAVHQQNDVRLGAGLTASVCRRGQSVNIELGASHASAATVTSEWRTARRRRKESREHRRYSRSIHNSIEQKSSVETSGSSSLQSSGFYIYSLLQVFTPPTSGGTHAHSCRRHLWLVINAPPPIFKDDVPVSVIADRLGGVSARGEEPRAEPRPAASYPKAPRNMHGRVLKRSDFMVGCHRCDGWCHKT